uniref:MAP7 domain-containing protein 2a isoform X3 n=1 Tax=Monopterus albus TaxID=43700 RepID=UPI0009B3261F|nr:MAP7 domain-containing protein 2-like isoform X3 [Monopterus albus]
MAKTLASSSAITGEKMASQSVTLLPDEKSPTNGHSSPAQIGKNSPSTTEKKPHINGHASPSHLAANTSNNHAGKQIVEGYTKTDDRMRLAKERREERERSLAREQLIREKERRAQLQYERTVEERWRRLEEQRQKEELRRAAVEEKRRQQLEEERERLEALMKRSLERSLQLEQRSKRWSRGCPTGAGDSENTALPFSAASVFSHGIASPLPAVSESAPCSPHRLPFCGSLNPADHSRVGLQGGSQSTPNTPKKERLRRERTASPGYGSPIRRSESPASVTKHLVSPTTSKLASKVRAQSPNNAHHYHYSPTRPHPNLASADKKVEKHSEQSKAETTVKKNANINSTNPSSQAEKNVVSVDSTETKSSKGEAFSKHLKGDTSETKQSPDRKNDMSPKMNSSEKKMQSNAPNGDKKTEPAPHVSTGNVAAGTTNAEEATRVLGERRRQARAQKELEEKKQEQQEEERPKEEQLRKQLAQEQQQQEAKIQQAKEKGKNEEDPHRLKHEDKQRKEQQQEKELPSHTDKEREKLKAQEDAERQRQDRELQVQHEDEERQLRKKRIEEIMKRTRKGEADLKKEEQVETKSVSPPGDVKTIQTKAQVNQASKKLEFQVKEQVQINTKGCVLVKKEAAAAQTDNQKSMQIKNYTHQVASVHNVPDKRSDTKQTSEEHGKQLNKEAKACVLKQQGREGEVNVNKQHKATVRATDQINKEPTKSTADAKVNQREGGLMNGAAKADRSALRSSRLTAEVSKQQSLHMSPAEGQAKGGSQVEVIQPSVTPLSVGCLSLPVIKLEPLDVKGTCDEVQSMEVSPASKEDLISIPEFSPVNEIQHSGTSNTHALEDLMDLTGSATCLKLSSESNIGDCNKNLIEGIVSPMSDSKLTGLSPLSSNKLSF